MCFDKKSDSLIINSNSKFRTRWDILIIVLSLWICFTLPVQIAFEPATLNGLSNDVINYFADIVYIIDLFLNFRTTFRNVLTGDEITDPKVLAWSYLRGRFVLDLIASIPFDMMLQDNETDNLSL